MGSTGAEMMNFLHMGGYAFYVWSAYSVAFIVLIANVLLSRKQRRKALGLLKKTQGKSVTSYDTSSKKT